MSYPQENPSESSVETRWKSTSGQNAAPQVASNLPMMYISHILTNSVLGMSRFLGEAFKDKAMATVKAATLATMLATPFHAANANEDADAEIHPGVTASAVTTVAMSRAERIKQEASEVNVPWRDSRKFRKEVIRTTTARSSKDGVTIAIYGDDPNLFYEAKLAVWAAYQEGIPAYGIIIGTADAPLGYDVYANGHRWAERTPEELALSKDIKNSILTSIRYAHSGSVLVQKELAQSAEPAAYTPE